MNSFVRFSACTAIAVLTLFFTPCVKADIMGFEGIYAPANWTSVTDGDSTIDTTGAPMDPSFIVMTSSNHLDGDPPPGELSFTTFSIVLAYSGTISFHWDYETTDIDTSTFDPFGYFLFDPMEVIVHPGSYDQLTTNGLVVPQAGNVVPFPLPVMAGQTFGFYMTSDGRNGAATTTITLFSAPGPADSTVVPEPATVSLLGIAVLTGTFWQFFKRRRPATTA